MCASPPPNPHPPPTIANPDNPTPTLPTLSQPNPANPIPPPPFSVEQGKHRVSVTAAPSTRARRHGSDRNGKAVAPAGMARVLQASLLLSKLTVGIAAIGAAALGVCNAAIGIAATRG